MAITDDAENKLFKERYKMEIARRIIQIAILAQAALLMSAANAGTFSNPDVIANGQLETFSGNVEANWYTFSLSAAGTVLVSGQTISGSFDPSIEVFKSDLSSTDILRLNPSDTVSLEAGDYYIQVSDSTQNQGGTFSLASTQLIPDPVVPSLEYTAGFNAGKQACIDDPESCGIESGGDFYVIPIPVKSK